VVSRKKPNRQTLNRQYSGQKKETKQAERTTQKTNVLAVWFLSADHCIVCSVFACLVSFFWPLYCLFSVCLFGFFLLATVLSVQCLPVWFKQVNTEQTIQWPKERNQTGKH
jgi:hypothetical protein